MFVTTPVANYTDFVTVIPASALNYWKNILPNALDAIAGGSYAIQAGQTIDFPAGGGDWNVDAEFTFTDGDIPLGGNCDVDGTITVREGGSIEVTGTGPFGFAGINVNSIGFVQWHSGGIGFFDAGSTLTITGTARVGGSSGVRTLYAGVDGLGPGHIVVDATGTATGSDLTISGGAWGIVTGSGSRLQLLSGALGVVDSSSIQFQTSSALNMLAGCDINLSASTTIAATLGADINGAVGLTGGPGSATNPGIDNALCGRSVARAWAVIAMTGSTGAQTVTNSYNVTSASLDGSGLLLTVTFNRAMTSPYSVQATMIAASWSGVFSVTTMGTGSFVLQAMDTGDVSRSLNSASLTIMITVHGSQ